MRRTAFLALVLLAASAQAAVTSTTTVSGPYTCNGTTVDFVAGFPFQATADLVVTTLANGSQTSNTLTLGTDYTVSGAGSASGTVTLTSGSKCAAGYTVTITRTLPLTQPTVFSTQGSFSPKVHERAFDRLEMQVQQIDRKAGDLTGPAGPIGPPGVTGTKADAITMAASNWTTRTIPSGAYQAVVNVGGYQVQTVAVGTNIAAYSDTHGQTWTNATIPTGIWIAVTKGYLYVAVGDSKVATNPTGSGTWTSHTIDAGTYHVVAAAGTTTGSTVIAAGGTNGQIERSTNDGVTWSQVKTYANVLWTGLATNHAGTWVVVGSNTNDDTVWSQSTNDGATWSATAIVMVGGDQYGDMVWTGTYWIYVSGNDAVGMRSSDLVTWTSIGSLAGAPLGCSSTQIVQGIVISNCGCLVTSTDSGTTWTAHGLLPLGAMSCSPDNAASPNCVSVTTSAAETSLSW